MGQPTGQPAGQLLSFTLSGLGQLAQPKYFDLLDFLSLVSTLSDTSSVSGNIMSLFRLPSSFITVDGGLAIEDNLSASFRLFLFSSKFLKRLSRLSYSLFSQGSTVVPQVVS